MTKILVFPMSRSAGCVRRVVDLLDPLARDHRAAAWNSRVNVTLRRLAENGVPKADASAEVSALLVEVKKILRRRQAARERTAARRLERERLRLVDPSQPDLFDHQAAPAAPATPHDQETGHVA